jgi:hypothetical protein
MDAISGGIGAYNTQQVIDTSLLKDAISMPQHGTQAILQNLDANLGQLLDTFA